LRKDIPFSVGTSRLLVAIFIGFFSCLGVDKIFAFSGFAGEESQAPAQGVRVVGLVAPGVSNEDVGNEVRRESIKKLDFVIHDLDYQIINLYTVTTLESEVLIEISSDILFDFDESSLKASAFASLRSASKRISEMARGDVRIEGHTDSKGADAYNQSLSEARAQSVYKWLVENGDLTGLNFVVSGFGETRPIEPNETDQGKDNPAGRQRNRRVEIIVNTSE